MVLKAYCTCDDGSSFFFAAFFDALHRRFLSLSISRLACLSDAVRSVHFCLYAAFLIRSFALISLNLLGSSFILARYCLILSAAGTVGLRLYLSLSSRRMWMWLGCSYNWTKMLQSCLLMRHWAYMSGRLGFILAPVCLALLSGLLFGLIPGLLTHYKQLPLISKNWKKMTIPNKNDISVFSVQ